MRATCGLKHSTSLLQIEVFPVEESNQGWPSSRRGKQIRHIDSLTTAVDFFTTNDSQDINLSSRVHSLCPRKCWDFLDRPFGGVLWESPLGYVCMGVFPKASVKTSPFLVSKYGCFGLIHFQKYKPS